jgi:hypothetical protein
MCVVYQSSFLDGSGTVSCGSPRRYSTLTPISFGPSVQMSNVKRKKGKNQISSLTHSVRFNRVEREERDRVTSAGKEINI